MRLLLLPPGLAVVPDEAVELLARLAARRSTTSYQPPRCRSLPTAGIRSAIFAASSMYSVLARRLFIRIRFQAIFRLCPTTARFCCQPQLWSFDQSSKNFSCTNGLLS